MFNKRDLLRWLKKKDPTETYHYWCSNCLIGQFMRAQGHAIRSVGVSSITFIDGKSKPLPSAWAKLAKAGREQLALNECISFGEALAVAEKLFGRKKNA